MTPSALPAVERLGSLTGRERAAVLASLTQVEVALLAEVVKYDWACWARPKQLAPPGDWRTWVICAGRGFGKTTAGAQWIRQRAEEGATRWATVLGPTRELTRKVLIEGPAGIVAVSPPWFRPRWEPTKLTLTWPTHPKTGVAMKARVYSADDPDRLRGEQHEIVWADELSAWKQAAESWAHVSFGLRLGTNPRGLVTMTPRPIEAVKDLVLGQKNAAGARVSSPRVVVVHGTSFENAPNLAAGTLEDLQARYGESRLGRQELYAEILTRPETALWSDDVIDRYRLDAMTPLATAIKRTIVSVDPSRSLTGAGDMCGIVVLASAVDGHAYVFEDASTRGGPLHWAQTAAAVAQRYRADAVIYETNAVSEGISKVIRLVGEASGTHWSGVTAQGTKRMRAEPIAALYAAGRVHHMGRHEHLEEEMASWEPTSNESPDRLDALVHGIDDLLLSKKGTRPPLVAV